MGRLSLAAEKRFPAVILSIDSLSAAQDWAETQQGIPMPLAVILSEAKDPGSSRGVGEQSKLRGFFAQNTGSE
jgi:hypothetical protein